MLLISKLRLPLTLIIFKFLKSDAYGNQLVRKGRKKVQKSSKTPALSFGFNTIKNKSKKYPSPFKEVSVLRCLPSLQETELCIRKLQE